ncbi:fructose 1,6-bisphosphatase [uncultured Nonlabens sp.]|uniref:fructose 1,6-bisphosphatase n=1 Tax=uncultured Nonlabens sp. TaxID=859306 RepID=UPI0026164C28|nr:fructose 1,6-bisphosphatase [uncultured Nonlabens sp.]
MPHNKSQAEEPAIAIDSSSKLEAIKNLIFGENIQQYDYEFDLLKKDLLNKRQELNEMIETTREELNKSIDSLSTDLNIRITDLETKLEDRLESIEDDKTSRSTLGDALIELGKKIKA